MTSVLCDATHRTSKELGEISPDMIAQLGESLGKIKSAQLS